MVLEGIERLCKTQQEGLEKVLGHNLKVADLLLSQAGAVGVSESEHTWTAVNQFSKEKQEAKLPVLKIGETVLTPNTAVETKTPIVDDVTALVGGVCTIFQKMNEQGDMLRVATNVQTLDKTRAVGTFIPAVNPDGKPNPVVSLVMKGETYVGRAFVVNAWYLTAYKPILDAQGKPQGMLFVGLKEQDNDELVKNIVSTKIGESGYPFVIDSQGITIVHPRAEVIGKNVITDMKINEMKEVLDKKEAGKIQVLRYTFEGRDKQISYLYFPKWDWIMCGSYYLDDMSKFAVAEAKSYLVREMIELYGMAQMDTPQGKKPMYSQVRLLDPKGNEVIVIKNGKQEEKLGTRADTEWFKKTVASKKDTVYVTRVEIAQNTGEPEIRLATPVYADTHSPGSDCPEFRLELDPESVCQQ